MRNNLNVSFGLQIAVAFGFFFYIGYLFDVSYDTKPFGILFGVFLALVYMGYELWKIIKE